MRTYKLLFTFAFALEPRGVPDDVFLNDRLCSLRQEALLSRKCPANFFKIGRSFRHEILSPTFPEAPLLIDPELVLIRWLEYKGLG